LKEYPRKRLYLQTLSFIAQRFNSVTLMFHPLVDYNEEMRTDIITARCYNPDISGDELSLKIASYPTTARYLATRLKNEGDIVCELCCGIGVSLIELAKSFKKVIGVDNDLAVIEDCDKNLESAGIMNYEILHGDVSDRNLLNRIKADVVLYDIPYWSTHAGQVDPEKQNPDLQQLIADIRELITDKIVIYAPTHMTYAEATSVLGPCEFMQIYMNGKHDRNFIFLGGLAKQAGKTKIEV
jgi:tRNA G37 N-methylase Trm5